MKFIREQGLSDTSSVSQKWKKIIISAASSIVKRLKKNIRK